MFKLGPIGTNRRVSGYPKNPSRFFPTHKPWLISGPHLDPALLSSETASWLRGVPPSWCLSYFFGRRQADCGLTVVGREHSDLTYNSANYQWRKGAERPDLQQCKLPVKEGSKATWLTTVHITSEEREHSDEGSRATWLTTVQITSEGREQSDLTYNSAYYQWRKGAQRPDLQQCILPVKEGSKATWRTIYKLTVALLL